MKNEKEIEEKIEKIQQYKEDKHQRIFYIGFENALKWVLGLTQ